MGKRNRYPGVTRLKKGLYEVRIQVKKHPRTGRSMEARRHVMAANAEEAWGERVQLREELLRGDGDLRAERPSLGVYASEWLLRRAVHLAVSTAERALSVLPRIEPSRHGRHTTARCYALPRDGGHRNVFLRRWRR